jgi:hypothetical protein
MAQPALQRVSREPRVLAHAPEELTRGRLIRLGEGIGKVVYASENWVVKRGRTAFEIVALIVLWRVLRWLERIMPASMGKRLLERPSRQIRFLRMVAQTTMAVLPRALWFTSHIREVWKQYHFRSTRGDRLAQEHLHGTSLVPEEVTFPSICVNVGGWPGTLTVSKATERVEMTLHEKLAELADTGRFQELEQWLERFLSARRSGWRLGLFSLDAHLKNYGVVQDRIVLLDSGGLTDRWSDIEQWLAREEEVAEPHVRLGLGEYLAERPDMAASFNMRWKATVNRTVLRDIWPRDHSV